MILHKKQKNIIKSPIFACFCAFYAVFCYNSRLKYVSTKSIFLVDKRRSFFYNGNMNVKDELLNQLLSGESVGGARLSALLGVSRNAVWKAVQELKAAGYEIDSQPSGYKLSGGNVLNGIAIKRYLSRDIDIDIRYETESTNDIAKGYAEQGRTMLVAADAQTSGRGRFKRSFASPHGAGAYFSVVLRPNLPLEKAQLLTAYAAVVTAKAITALSGGEVKIKWVNDLFMDGKKFAAYLPKPRSG